MLALSAHPSKRLNCMVSTDSVDSFHNEAAAATITSATLKNNMWLRSGLTKSFECVCGIMLAWLLYKVSYL